MKNDRIKVENYDANYIANFTDVLNECKKHSPRRAKVLERLVLFILAVGAVAQIYVILKFLF